MDTAPKKVLIIDDDSMLRAPLREALRARGIVTFEAENGRDGLSMTMTEHPNLIILDLGMPVMDGPEFLRALRQDEWGKTADVVLLTNYATLDKVGEAMTLGVTKYFLKAAYDLSDLVERLVAEIH